jgi:hypothetical protein
MKETTRAAEDALIKLLEAMKGNAQDTTPVRGMAVSLAGYVGFSILGSVQTIGNGFESDGRNFLNQPTPQNAAAAAFSTGAAAAFIAGAAALIATAGIVGSPAGI